MSDYGTEPTQCHFCGTYVRNGYDNDGRHWLSDCRPDLVEHEIGPTCTWWNLGNLREGEADCYAYQDGRTWTDQHIHFYKDGPMG